MWDEWKQTVLDTCMTFLKKVRDDWVLPWWTEQMSSGLTETLTPSSLVLKVELNSLGP